MDPDDKTLTIVYQFGKVASTSLVNTLKTVPGLDVHQSHFLGESALQRIVPIAVDKSTNAYFHEHLRGQLLANVELTYRMNRVLAGHGTATLKVISLSREPLDWLRSGILQDIAGYRGDLLEFAARDGLAGRDEGETIGLALISILAQVTEMIDRKGGMVSTVEEFHALGGKEMLAPLGPGIDLIVRKFFFLALRPHTWFKEHFQPCFGIGLGDFAAERGFWVVHRPRADFVLLRYEDLAKNLAPAFEALGFDHVGPLLRDNVSQSKTFSGTVDHAFASPEAAALRARMRSSRYAQFFGYGEPVAAVDAAAE